MHPILIAMTLLGCSDAGDQCQPVRTLQPRYASVAACNAAAEAVLTRQIAISYPVMAVHCDKAGPPAVAEISPLPAG